MTKAAALYQFFNSFSVRAYPTTDVPDDVAFPYLTYELSVGAFEEATNPTVELWDYSTSNVPINEMAQRIDNRCKAGATIRFDGGGAVIYSGPWVGLRDDVSIDIKRRRSIFTIHWVSNT